MNWVANFYFREGPGIDKDAPKPEGLRLLGAVLAREWWDLLRLNVLFIAACLPLVTVPAAYFAAVSVCVAMIEDRNVYLWRDFWAAFRSRFWVTTVGGAVFAAAAVLAWVAIPAYAAEAKDNLVFAAPFALAVVVSVLLPLTASSFFVSLAKAEGPEAKLHALGQVIRIAALAVLARPLPGLAALGVVAGLWLAHILFYPVSVFLPVLVNFSLGALLMSFAMLKGVELGCSRTARNS